MTLVQTEPKKIYLWNNELKAVYLWTTKVRPSVAPITTSWIYRNQTDGLISLSSNWSTWLTIADKNLGATTVYNFWDTISEANCGKYYQWWNNYWFPFTWSVTTSTTRVDLSSYWPWNYYSSSVYMMGLYKNPNARGWTTWTNEAKKWPCNTWYHIPAKSELESLYNIFTSLWLSSPLQRAEYLKMPFAWGRDKGSSLWQTFNQWINWRYRSATWYAWWSGNYQDWYFLDFNAWNINPWNDWNNSYWHSIRPFKNDAVQPDTSRTKLN